MIEFKKMHRLVLIIMIITGSLILSSCGIKDRAADPGDWGYECKVTYDALGGTINTREVRETYYMANSYVFKPAGTTNMLIEPVKDGYVLAGWYTAKKDVKDADGNITYKFNPEDRWDFDEDRVQSDMTLYARWIPQATVDYVDPSTDEVKFSKDITEDSAMQELSSAAERLIMKKGFTFEGYYADKDCTIPYDFTEYEHQRLVPSNEEVYARLYEEFPNYIKKVPYKEPEEKEPATDGESDTDEELDPEVELASEEDTSDLFINKIGYEITTDDEKVRERIRKSKDRIYEESIKKYIENSADKTVYLKYSEGNFVRITKAEDLKTGGKVGFLGVDKTGNPIDGYIISNDIDFEGVSLTMGEKFSGKIIGNGHSLKNIIINVKSKKIDKDKSKTVGLFEELDGAHIEDLTFENMSIKLNVNSGIPVTAGPLAAQGSKTELKNVKFVDLNIDTGKGDDGAAAYKIGDVFGVQRNNKLDNVTGENITITSSESAQINSLLK